MFRCSASGPGCFDHDGRLYELVTPVRSIQADDSPDDWYFDTARTTDYRYLDHLNSVFGGSHRGQGSGGARMPDV
jgi:hypothetical protein